MKKVILATLIAACFASTANANEKSKALTLCKEFVNENFAEANRRKVVKIKERASHVEIKYSISQDDGKVKGRCVVKNGEVNFTTDGMALAKKS
jgi:hypothetical protein